LVARRLAPVRFLLCAAPSYLERRGAPGHPDELRRHACLLYGTARRWGEWAFRRPGGGTTRVSVDGTVRVGAGGVLRAVAVAGAGITMLPTFVVGDELRAGRLVEVLRDWPMAGLEERAVWAVYPSNRAIPPKVRAFVDFLAAHIGDSPYWDRDL
jgi:DNA-binding transcriptional LysR family regulator